MARGGCLSTCRSPRPSKPPSTSAWRTAASSRAQPPTPSTCNSPNRKPQRKRPQPRRRRPPTPLPRPPSAVSVASPSSRRRSSAAVAEPPPDRRRRPRRLIRLAAAGIQLIHMGHAFRRQHCPDDPDDRDDKTEDEENVVLVLERPNAKNNQENEIQDA